MPSRKADKKKKDGVSKSAKAIKTALKVGDTVMIIAGGNGEKRPNKGQTGKLLRFVGKKRDRVVVEGLNMHTKHKRQMNPDDKAAKVPVEGSVHVSNVMYYVDKLKKPVRIKYKLLEDGKKVRGYVEPDSDKFIQV